MITGQPELIITRFVHYNYALHMNTSIYVPQLIARLSGRLLGKRSFDDSPRSEDGNLVDGEYSIFLRGAISR